MKQIETKYNEAVQQIKSAILQSQLEAAKAVNRQMLALYYGFSYLHSFMYVYMFSHVKMAHFGYIKSA